MWAFKQVMWVFSIFSPIWTYLDGWETDALVSLVDLVHLFLQHHCLLSQVLQTLWALLGAVMPLPQLKTAQTPSLSELSLVRSCPSSSLKHSTKRWWCLWLSWIHIAQTLSLCRYFKNQVHFGPIMQHPHHYPLFKIHITVKTQMVENPTWRSWLDKQKKKERKKCKIRMTQSKGPNSHCSFVDGEGFFLALQGSTEITATRVCPGHQVVIHCHLEAARPKIPEKEKWTISTLHQPSGLKDTENQQTRAWII